MLHPTLRVIPGVWNFIRYLRQFFKLRRRDLRDAGCVAFDSMIREPLSGEIF